MVRHKRSKELYALKSIRKVNLIESKDIFRPKIEW